MTLSRVLFFCVATAAASTSAQALVCPLPQSVAKPGVIVEPEAAITKLTPLLNGDGVARRAGEIVSQVRKIYPTAKPEELVNFLVTAYCPVANRRNMGEAEKQALVNAFAAAVTQQLY